MNKRSIVFLGDSLTEGYDLRPEEAYPALIQKKINQLNWLFHVINAGVSGDTTDDGLTRLPRVLQSAVHVLVLELGINDGLHNVPVTQIQDNLQRIIDLTKKTYPQVKVVLAGMKVPPEMGLAYGKDFENLFPALAEKNKAPLVPFLLEGVARVPELNLPDGIHPTAAGQKIMAENVWKVLRLLLEKM